MTTRKELEKWDGELHELAKRFGDGDKTEWLLEYIDFKQKILDGCNLSRYANGLQIADTILYGFGGYEYLAVLFAKMKLLDDAMRGIIEQEGDK
jgi:hypothetical protein